MVATSKFLTLLASFLLSSMTVSAMFNATRSDFIKVYKQNGLRIPAAEGDDGAAADVKRELQPLMMRSNDVVARAAADQAAPHWTIYQDLWAATPPDASQIAGFNAYYLAFVLTSGPFDMAQQWVTMSPDARSALKSSYAASGIKLMASAFGGTDHPTTNGADPVALANTMAEYVKTYGLDGLDIDYEDFDAMAGGTAENWLIAFTNQLRAQLPAPQYIITHAPVAPWFTPSLYPGGGYLKVHQEVGSKIDWYNLQFYNQGTTEYTTCDGLLNQSTAFPKTSVFEIAASGVPLDKLVIGKPAGAEDATNGQMDPSLLAQCLQTAKGKGWTGGAMVWQFPHADTNWIKTVRSLSWPM